MKNDVRWVYKCSLGEFEVWASSKDEVVKVLLQHGFMKHKINKDNIIEYPTNDEHEEVR